MAQIDAVRPAGPAEGAAWRSLTRQTTRSPAGTMASGAPSDAGLGEG